MAFSSHDDFASGWFGVGRWDAPYWFVGMEPGGDEAAANEALWEQQGRPAFTDITITHPSAPVDWFGPQSKTQATWAKLIWLLLAYEGKEPTTEATLEYQRRSLGRLTGETALLELSAFAAVSTGHAAPRDRGRAERIATIAERMREHRPEFAVFYSTSYADDWAQIVGATLIEGQPVLVGTTACVMTYHPASPRGNARSYWMEIAARLRAARAASGG